jgi:hypothetical protein
VFPCPVFLHVLVLMKKMIVQTSHHLHVYNAVQPQKSVKVLL